MKGHNYLTWHILHVHASVKLAVLLFSVKNQLLSDKSPIVR